MTPPARRDPAGTVSTGRERGRAAQRAFLALGSNLGDRRAHLARGIAVLPDVVAVSGVYETRPVGGPPQPPYLNCVAELRTSLTAHELLAAARAAEDGAGRVRTERWGPRTLDVDVLLVGEETVDDTELTVPHPRMWERAFVLVPLADLAPEIAAPHLAALASTGADRTGADRARAGGAGSAVDGVTPAGTVTD